MSNEKNTADNSSAANSTESTASQGEKNIEKQPLPFHNPLDSNDHKQITQEDLENEQKYKEALSERD